MKSYPSRLTHKQPGLSSGLRALLVIALLALVAYLPVFVFAKQTGPVPSQAAATDKSADNSEVFVIYRDAKGESVCRRATPAEEVQLRERNGAGPVNTIYAGGRRVKDARYSPMTTESGTALLPSAGLRIVLHATSQLQSNPVARDAFIVAANRWEAVVSTPITVVVDVDFGTTFFGQPWGSPNILGATGTANINLPFSEVKSRLIQNAPGAEELQLYNALPANGVPVELNGVTTNASLVRTTQSVARAIGFVPDVTNPDSLVIGQGDAGIGFNSAHAFDFDPSNGISAGTLDFDAVVVHEMGHALGFTSGSGNGVSSPLSLWDIFRFRPGAASLGTVATAARVMSEGGEQVFFNSRTNSFGTLELQLSTGGSDGVGGDGEQSSHWKDDTFTSFIGIMDPTLASGQRETITSNDLSALDTFGYMIGGTAPPPPPPPPAPANDNFSAATPLSGASGSTTGTTFGSTGEPGEPDHASSTSASRESIWYSWTATTSASANFNTSGSNYDTVLAVYTGNAVNSLTLVAANDDVELGIVIHSSVTFAAAAGTTYRIAVAGFRGDTGNVTLNWSPDNVLQIAGRVTNPDGTGVSGLQIFISGSASTLAVTNANGDFIFSQLHVGGNYTLGPDFQGGLTSFTPSSYTFNNLTSNQTANFLRTTLRTFRISGRIADANGVGVGAIIQVPGSTTPIGGLPILPTFTDSNGNYIYDLPEGGNYNVTPSNEFWDFSPPFISFTNLNADHTANFVATQQVINPFGRVLENNLGLAGVTITLRELISGTTRTTVTASDGTYHFQNVGRGVAFSITPEKQSYVFNPPSLTASGSASLSDIVATRGSQIDTSDFFVRQHYRDFLNREGDTAGVLFWVANIELCGSDTNCRSAKRVDTSAAFFLSIEFQETGYLAYRFYKSAYGNIPGAPVPVRFAEFLPDTQQIGQGVQVGIGDWLVQLETNKQAYALDFVTRPRFINAFPTTLTPTQFVDALYAKAQVTPSDIERLAAIAQFGLASDTTNNAARSRVLRMVAENSQLKNQELNKAFVLMQYFGYLRRNPDDAPELTRDFAGYNFWLNKLNQFNGDFRAAEMVKAFIVSGEYRQRFDP